MVTCNSGSKILLKLYLYHSENIIKIIIGMLQFVIHLILVRLGHFIAIQL